MKQYLRACLLTVSVTLWFTVSAQAGPGFPTKTPRPTRTPIADLTPQPTRTRPTCSPTPTFTATPAPGDNLCPADCDGGGYVTVNELLAAVGGALDDDRLDSCPEADADGDGRITMSDLIRAVRASLDGCAVPFEDLGQAGAVPVDVLRRGDPLIIGERIDLEAFSDQIGFDFDLPADFDFNKDTLAVTTYANAEPHGGGPVIDVRRNRSGLVLTVRKVVPGVDCITLEVRRRRYTSTLIQLIRLPRFATPLQARTENQTIPLCCGCCT